MSPFQLMIDPAEALRAAQRLRSHLPPYSVLPSQIVADDDEDETQHPQEPARQG
jgi:hypothetical protein